MLPRQFVILLLAAGLSRRMGPANKLLLPFGQKTLLETTLDHLEAAALGELMVIVGHEAGLLRPLLHGRTCRVLENPDYGTGMTSSIKTGVAAAAPNSNGFMICLADMPLITPAEYRLLADAFEAALAADAHAIVQPRYGERRGNPVIFSAVYREALLTLDEAEGARSVVKAHIDHLFLVDMPTDAVLCDADTPEAYRLLLKNLNT